MKNMFLDPTAVINKKFTVNDPAVEYTCIGYSQNETFIVFGASNDVTNNRFSVKSFKLTDAKFVGQA